MSLSTDTPSSNPPLSEIITDQANTTPLIVLTPLPTTTNKKKKGRPCGTTNKDMQRLEKAKKDCIHEITRLYFEERARLKEQHGDGAKVPNGFLRDLIAVQKENFSLTADFHVPLTTIRSRLRVGRSMQPAHRGTPSPWNDTV